MIKKHKKMSLIMAVASSVMAVKTGTALGQTTYVWNGNAGGGIWQTGVSQTNWDGNVYGPGNGGGNNFVFADPAYNQSVTTITLTGGHNPNIDNFNISSSMVTPLTFVIAGGNTGNHMDLEVPAGVDSIDVFATGATINATTINGITGEIQLFGAAGLWNVSGANVFTVNAPIVDTGTNNRGFIKTGTGTLVLGGTSAFDGGLYAYEGTIQLQTLANQGVDSAAGSGAANAPIRISNSTSTSFLNGAVVYAGPDTSTNRQFLIAQDIQSIPTSATDAASLTSTSGTLTLTGGIVTGNANSNATTYTNLTIGGAGNIIVNTVGVNGYLGLTKAGTGLVQINAASSYLGNTNVSTGTLTVGGAVSGSQLFIVSSGATLNVSNYGSISPTAAVLNAGNLNFNSLLLGTFGPVSGSGALTVSGGQLTLSGSNTYAGGTNINAGTLVFSGNQSVPATGVVAVASGATLSFVDGSAQNTTIPSTLQLARGAEISFDAVGGSTDQLTLGSAPVIAGNVVINMASAPSAGSYNLITAPSGLSAGTYLLANATNYTGTLTATDTSVSLTATQANSLTTAYWFGGQVTDAGNAMALSSGTTSNWAMNATDTTATAAGVVPGSNTNVYFSNTAGGATQESNVVLGANMVVSSLTFNDPTPVTISADGNAITLKSSGTGSSSAISANASATINANIVLGTTETWTTASGQTLTVGGSIGALNGLGFGLTLTGGGVFVLNGVNTNSGATYLTAGSLTIGSSGSLASSALNVSSGASAMVLAGGSLSPTGALVDNGTVTFNSASQSVATLNGAGALTLNGTALTVTNGGTFSGPISSTGSLNLTGSTFTLTGTDSFTGGTTVTAGTLKVNPVSLTTSGYSTGQTGILDLTLSGSTTIAVPVTGIGTIIKESLSNLTFASSFNATTVTMDGGTLTWDHTNNPASDASYATVTLLNGSGLSLLGNSTATITEPLTGIVLGGSGNLTGGSSQIMATSASAHATNLSLGTITAFPNATVDFNKIPTGTGTAAILTTNAATNGVLGAYATYNQSDWATVSSSAIVPLGSYSAPTIYAATNNTLFSAASTNLSSTGITTVNSVKLYNTSGQAVAVNFNASGDTLSLASGGILVPAGMSGNTSIGTTTSRGNINTSSNALYVQDYGSAALTINSNIANNASSTATTLTKAGTGLLSLTGTNTYTCTTFLDGGTLLVSTNANLGSNSSSLVINGGTFNVSSSGLIGPSSTVHPVIIGAQGATFDFNFVAFSGNGLTGSGPITFSGGTWGIGGSQSTYSGYVTLLTGRLYFTDDSFQNIPGMNVGSGAMYNIVDNGTPTYNFKAGATLMLAGNGVAGSTTPGALVVTGQSGAAINATFSDAVQLDGNASIGLFNSSATNGSALTLSNIVSGPYMLTKLGTGPLTLSATNTYSGGTQVSQGALTGTGSGAFGAGDMLIAPTLTTNAGWVIVNSNGSFAPTANVTVNSNNALANGTLNLYGTSETIGSLSGNSIYSSVYLGGSGGTSLTTGNSTNTTFAGVISDGTSTGSSGAGSLALQGTGTFTLTNTNTYTGGTFVKSGTLVLDNGASLPVHSNLMIGTGTVVFANNSGGAATALNINQLSIAGTNNAWTGQLDLTNNAAIIHNSNVATVFNQVAQGYNGGAWNGSGITSSAAASDSGHLTALGVIINSVDQSGGTALMSTFAGQSVVNSDILLKYTYYGDTNLDGAVDGSDYSRIDNAYSANQTSPGSMTGWFNGDFNYDGVIDGSDYTLIDNAYNMQGSQIESQIANPTAQIGAGVSGSISNSAVPEPASLGVVSLLAIGLLGRRRRRR